MPITNSTRKTMSPILALADLPNEEADYGKGKDDDECIERG